MNDQAQEQSVEDRLSSLLESEDTEEIKDEVAEGEEQEAEDSESEEDKPEEPQTIRLKRGEEEVEVDLEEAKNLAQMGYDYTKKTQEVAEQRRQLEAHAQAIHAQEQMLQQQAEMQQALIKDIAKVESLAEQISQYEGVNWAQISDSDPVQAQKLWIQYQMLINQRTQAEQNINGKAQQLNAQREQQNALRLQQARADLVKIIPDWSPEKATAVRETGKAYGFTDGELDGVTDPRMVKVLADAAAFRKMQSEKPVTTKKVSDKPPVVKPGAKDIKRSANSDYVKARQDLKKTGRPELAAKLIERMI